MDRARLAEGALTVNGDERAEIFNSLFTYLSPAIQPYCTGPLSLGCRGSCAQGSLYPSKIRPKFAVRCGSWTQSKVIFIELNLIWRYML
ncbi:phospholipase a-2-activating protein [Moniliophthora roreri]|nr:phospholipase a-2-activating protein [Moniliophthora roreri]